MVVCYGNFVIYDLLLMLLIVLLWVLLVVVIGIGGWVIYVCLRCWVCVVLEVFFE